jgi:hypothetical protein
LYWKEIWLYYFPCGIYIRNRTLDVTTLIIYLWNIELIHLSCLWNLHYLCPDHEMSGALCHVNSHGSFRWSAPPLIQDGHYSCHLGFGFGFCRLDDERLGRFIQFVCGLLGVTRGRFFSIITSAAHPRWPPSGLISCYAGLTSIVSILCLRWDLSWLLESLSILVLPLTIDSLTIPTYICHV